MNLSPEFSGTPGVKNSPVNAEDIKEEGLIPGSGRFPGGENGNPLQYSCRENPMDKEAWWATVHGVSKSRTRLSNSIHRHAETFLSVTP